MNDPCAPVPGGESSRPTIPRLRQASPHYPFVKIYRRHLPHWDAPGEPVFVTFRLDGTLPANGRFARERITTGRAFVCMDRLLDRSTAGPLFLRQPAIAKMVAQAIDDGARKLHRYDLHAFVVMPNHVHLLVTPLVSLPAWLGPLKGFTGLQANHVLGRSGAFWQEESFDRLVRSDAEFVRTQEYIEMNPVSAGLARAPEDFPWSSAAK